MSQGKIVRKNEKGFGFIKSDDLEKDLFFHANDVKGVSFDDLQEGEEVSFNIAESDKGPKAENVERV